MKKILLFTLLCLFAFSSKAQELTFEETVKYIKEKVENSSVKVVSINFEESYHINTISFTNKGNITMRFLFFKELDRDSVLKFNLFDLYEINGIKLEQNYVYFKVTTARSIAVLFFNTSAEAERIYKAFIHLRSLCTKEKDPFDN